MTQILDIKIACCNYRDDNYGCTYSCDSSSYIFEILFYHWQNIELVCMVKSITHTCSSGVKLNYTSYIHYIYGYTHLWYNIIQWIATSYRCIVHHFVQHYSFMNHPCKKPFKNLFQEASSKEQFTISFYWIYKLDQT